MNDELLWPSTPLLLPNSSSGSELRPYCSIEYCTHSSYQRVLVGRYAARQNTVSSGRWFPFRTLCLHVVERQLTGRE